VTAPGFGLSSVTGKSFYLFEGCRLKILFGYACEIAAYCRVMALSFLSYRGFVSVPDMAHNLRRHTLDADNEPLHKAFSWSGWLFLGLARWFLFDVPGLANSVHVRFSMAIRSNELTEVKKSVRLELQTLAIVVRAPSY